MDDIRLDFDWVPLRRQLKIRYLEQLKERDLSAQPPDGATDDVFNCELGLKILQDWAKPYESVITRAVKGRTYSHFEVHFRKPRSLNLD